MNAAGLLPGLGELARGCLAERHLRTAREGLLIRSDLAQNAARGLHVSGFAVMGCATQRQLLLGEFVAIGHTIFHQRQRLDRLDRGARIRDQRGVAGTGAQLTVRVDNCYMHAVARFHDGAAPDFYD